MRWRVARLVRRDISRASTPDISRRPQTLLMLERLIDHINGHDRVRWATFNEIADYSLSRFLRSGESGPFVFDQF